MRTTALFKPFSYSCKSLFIDEHGENAYAEMKKLVEKIVRAVMSWANRCGAIVAIWYKAVAYNEKG